MLHAVLINGAAKIGAKMFVFLAIKHAFEAKILIFTAIQSRIE